MHCFVPCLIIAASMRIWKDLCIDADVNEMNVLCRNDLSTTFDAIDYGVLLARRDLASWFEN